MPTIPDLSKTILVVDDEPDIRELIGFNLLQAGYRVETAENGAAGIKMAIRILPDLILLDVMMPEMDGIEACKQLREHPKTKGCLIAFLSARGEDYSQIAGFDSGADDYITKPIAPSVLIKRVEALMRRIPNSEAPDQLAFGAFTIDRNRYIVTQNNVQISLPKKEFELLFLLCSDPGKVFTRDRILSKVWGHDVIVGDRTIDVHIRKLRSKLGKEHFTTIKGVGYKFDA
jgi:two-component system alkaline phosphatase synthesis response regulator PhoP